MLGLAYFFVSHRVLHKTHSLWLTVRITQWAATLLGMIGVSNFGQIMALRFLLGFFESALVPGLLLGAC